MFPREWKPMWSSYDCTWFPGLRQEILMLASQVSFVRLPSGLNQVIGSVENLHAFGDTVS
jgi:hypothetical protein